MVTLIVQSDRSARYIYREDRMKKLVAFLVLIDGPH